MCATGIALLRSTAGPRTNGPLRVFAFWGNTWICAPKRNPNLERGLGVRGTHIEFLKIPNGIAKYNTGGRIQNRRTYKTEGSDKKDN